MDHESGLEMLARASAGHGWLSGRLAADPELAMLWRNQVALVEAARSAWLEGYAISEAQIVAALNDSRPTDADQTGLRIAEATWRTLQSLPDLDLDGLRTLEVRGDRDVHLVRLKTDGSDYGVELAGESAAEITERREACLEVISRLSRRKLPLLLKTVLTAQAWAAIGSGSIPGVNHRLMLMAAERHWMAGDPLFADRLARAEGRQTWIWAPAAASASMHAHLWQPGSPNFSAKALAQLALWCDEQALAIGKLDAWRRAARETFVGRRSTSKKSDLLATLWRQPVLRAEDVSKTLGISAVASRSLLADAQAAGVVEEISGRSSYRIYTTPFLAQARRPEYAARKTAAKRLAISIDDAAARETTSQSQLPGTGVLAERIASSSKRESAEDVFDALFMEIDEAARHADAVSARSKELFKQWDIGSRL